MNYKMNIFNEYIFIFMYIIIILMNIYSLSIKNTD